MGPWGSTPSTGIHEHPVRCTGRGRAWAHGRVPHPNAYTSILRAAQVGIAHGPMGQQLIHELPQASCALHRQGSLMGPWHSTPSTNIHEHPGRRNKSESLMGPWEPPASASIMCADQVGIAHGPHGITSHPGASTSSLGAATSRDRAWVHGRAPPPRAATRTLRAAQAGITYGYMGEHTTHEHPRASCALHMGPWGSTPSTSIHEHHVRCTSREPSWVHGRAPSKSIHEHPGRCNCWKRPGPMREHSIHEHPREACALNRQGSPMGSW